jgi:glucose-6-phosphate isomerase
MPYTQANEYLVDHSTASYKNYYSKALSLLDKIRGEGADGKLALFDIRGYNRALASIKELAGLITKFKKVIVLGTGGSTLNGQTLTAISSSKDKLIFWDNIDPDTINSSVSKLDLARTAVLAISKSGETLEALTQLLLLIDTYRKHNIPSVSDHFFGITTLNNNPIHSLINDVGGKSIAHANIGGRFSGLSAVGLLPASIAGLDAASFIRGADFVLNSNLELVAVSVADTLSMIDQGYTANIMLTYADRLSPLNTWFRQIWAESLGKNGFSMLPIKAVGTLDQHSQLQLYLGGKRDKIYTFITLNEAGKGATLNAATNTKYSYLNNKTVGDVIQAEQNATYLSFKEAGLPVRRFTIAELSEYTLGALMMHLTLEVVTIAYMLELNPFDQPAVERGKELAVQMLRYTR